MQGSPSGFGVRGRYPVTWGCELVKFPDRALVRYLVDGMRHGFRVGYKRGVAPLVGARRNMLSADANPAVVEAYLRKGRDFLTGNCVCDGYQDGNLKPHCMLVIIL